MIDRISILLNIYTTDLIFNMNDSQDDREGGEGLE